MPASDAGRHAAWADTAFLDRLEGAWPRPGAALRLGRFRLLRPLGQGAFGLVYLAEDTELWREVALKVPLPEALLTPELRQRFLFEGRAAAGLDHPNIVPVYEADQVGTVCYIASAYCPGQTLAEWLARRREPVPVRWAAGLVALLADAVHYSHGRGVLHRDLKPANVLLQQGDAAPTAARDWPAGEGVPRICDFGMAKVIGADNETTARGVILGTPSYMSPEQAAGRKAAVGPATDVYALGVILYEVLAGRLPFEGDGPLDTLRRVANEEPAPPRRLRRDVPRDLETICLKCLRKEPAARYACAADLAADLRRYLNGEPVLARPVGPAVRFWRACRRRPAVTLLALGLIAAVVAGFVGMLAYALRADEARRRAEDHFTLAHVALDDLYSLIACEPAIANNPELQARRLATLERNVGLLRRLEAQRPPDNVLRLTLARNVLSLGHLHRDSGEPELAERHYREAERLTARLCELDPQAAVYRVERIQAAAYLGEALRHRGASPEALAVLRRGVDCPDLTRHPELLQEKNSSSVLHAIWVQWGELESAAGTPVESEVFLRRLMAFADQELRLMGDGTTPFDLDTARLSVDLLLRLGCSQWETRHYREALHTHRAQYRLTERLARSAPDNPLASHLLATSAYFLGRAEEDTGRPEEAIRRFRESAALRQRLRTLGPTDPDNLSSLSACHHKVGSILCDTGREAAGMDEYATAIRLREEVCRLRPRHTGHLCDLAATWRNLGMIQKQAGRINDAANALRRERDYLRQAASLVPDNAEIRRHLGVNDEALRCLGP